MTLYNNSKTGLVLYMSFAVLVRNSTPKCCDLFCSDSCASAVNFECYLQAVSLGYPLNNEEFSSFIEQSVKCADFPVPSLLYVSRGVETRLGTLNVEAKWLSKQPRSLDDITVCTNSNFER